MRELTRSPTAALRPFVRSLSFAPPGPAEVTRDLILPGVSMSLWVNLHEDEFRRFLGPGNPTMRTTSGAMLAGPTDRAMVVEIEALRSHVCVDFNVAAGIFFQAGAEPFRNEWAALDDIWGATGAVVRDRLLDAATPADKLDVIEQVLTEQLADNAVDPAMSHAAAAFSRGERVADVADSLGLLPKTLLRRFVKATGLTPKRFARVERLRRVTDAVATAASVDWAHLAFEHGYSDQPHLIDDFRDLVGVTPSYYGANRVNGPNHVAPPSS